MENREDGATSYDIRFFGELRCVPPLRRFISEIAKAKGYSSRESFRIETIVDEVVNNAIEHGDASHPEISLETRIGPKAFQLTVHNKARSEKTYRLKRMIQSAEAAVPLDEGVRGRGLALVKLMSDSVDVAFDQAGASVTITKKREND